MLRTKLTSPKLNGCFFVIQTTPNYIQYNGLSVCLSVYLTSLQADTV